MNLAYIITAHKSPHQLVRLVERLNTEGATFLIHVEKKTDAATYGCMVEGLRHLPNVQFLRKRYASHPQCLFGVVQATIDGINAIFEQGITADYVINLSGEDYPIKPNREIKRILQQGRGRSFVTHFPLPFEGVHRSGWTISQRLNRIQYWHVILFNHYFRLPLRRGQYSGVFSLTRSLLGLAINLFLPKKRQFPAGFVPYGGWAWWCLAKEHAEYIHRFAKTNCAFVRFFRYVDAPDEIIFHTILLNSPFKDRIIDDDLRYIDWSTGGRHPKILGKEDFEKLARAPKLFARKFDASVDGDVLDLIDEHILNEVDTAICHSPSGSLANL